MTPGYNEDYYSEVSPKYRRTKNTQQGSSQPEEVIVSSGLNDEYSSYSIPPPHRGAHNMRGRSKTGYSSDEERYNNTYPAEYKHDNRDYDYNKDETSRSYPNSQSFYNTSSSRPLRPPPPRRRSVVRSGYMAPPPPRYHSQSRERYQSDGYYNDDDYNESYDDRDFNRNREKDRIGSKRYNNETYPSRSSSKGSSRAMGVIVAFIFAFLILYLFRVPIMQAIENAPSTPTSYQQFPEQLDFTVRKSMTLEVNPTNQRPNDYISYKLKTACPKDRIIKVGSDDFFIQDVKEVKIQPEPSSGFPNLQSTVPEIMLWDDSRFSGTKTFIVEYTITTRFLDWDLTEDDSGFISNITTKLKTQYNHDEWRIDLDHDGVLDNEINNDDDIDDDGRWDYMIEPSNPEIQDLANDLAGNEENVYKAVKKIYDYLTLDENLNYVTSNTGLPKACSTTITDLRGDCDDYSILFISLCRALDIPAWLELGVLYDRQTKAWGGHAWSKVAIPLKSGGYAAPVLDIVNKQFMFFDPYRFVEWIDTGGDDIFQGEDEARNNLDYYYHTFSYISTGNPEIISPNTNEFLTLSLEEVGDKIRITSNGKPISDLCMVPGFEGDVVISSFMILLTFGLMKFKNRKKTQ